MPEDSMVIGQGGAAVNFPDRPGADWGMRPGIDAIEGPPGYGELLAGFRQGIGPEGAEALYRALADDGHAFSYVEKPKTSDPDERVVVDGWFRLSRVAARVLADAGAAAERDREAALAATLKETLEPLRKLKAFLVDRLAYDEAAGIADIIGAAEHLLHDPTSER